MTPFAARLIIETDIALTTYQGRDGLTVFARSLETAKPIEGLDLGLFAQPQSLQYSSFVATKLADAAAEKSAQVTIASVIFVVALLLLGVAGVNASWRVAAALTGGAALAYLGGLLYLVFTLF